MVDEPQDLKDEIKLGVDASGVETGVGRAKRSIEDLGSTVEGVGKRGGEGLNRLGQGGVEAGQKVDQVTRNMVNSLQRQIAAAEAGGTATRQYQESIARLRGANMDVLRPYLDQLDAANDKTEEAKRSSEGLMSTMRSFGNVLGGLAGGLAAAFSLRTFIDETIAAEQEQAQLAAVLHSTGEAAGWSREQLNAMADSLAGKSIFSAGEINQAQTRLLSYTNVVGKEFPRAMQAVIDMSARMGMDVRSSAETIGRALDVPSEGLTALTRQGFRFSEAQKNLVERLEETGRTAEAQGIILAALESSYGGAAEAARNTFGGSLYALKNTINNLMTGEGGSVDSMRAGVESLTGALGSSQTKQAFQSFLGWIATVSASAVTGTANLLAFVQTSNKLAIIAGTDQYGQLKSQAEAYSRQIEVLTGRAERFQEAISRGDSVEQNQRSLDRTRERLAQLQRQAMATTQSLKDLAGVPPLDWSTRNASAATDPRRLDLPKPVTSGRGPGKEAIDAARKEAAEQAKIMAELSGLTASFEADWERLNRMYTTGALSLQQLTAAQAALLEKQPAIKAAIAEEAKAREAALKNAQQLADARNRESDGIEAWLRAQQAAAQQALQSVQGRVQGLRDEEAATTMAAQLNLSLAEAIERVAIARLQEKQAGLREGSDGWQAIQKEIDARKELLGLVSSKAARDTAAEAAKKAADDWQRTTDQINQSLTDALMRGFESGKDFAKNLRDTVVNMFKTMVLRPVISAIVNPFAGAITGAMGLSGAAQAGQGISALGTVGNVASIASGIGSFTTAGMLPAGLATALTGSTSSLAMGLSGAWGAGGGMLSTLNAGASMLGSGSIMSGLGTLAGALGPIALGIAALAAIFGKKATPHAGAASTYSEAGGLVSGADIYRSSGLADVRTYNAGVEQVTGNVAKAIGDTLNSTAKAFGKTAGYEITTAFADDTSKDGAWGSLVIKRMGETLLDWRDTQTSKWAPKEFADGEAGSKEYLAAIAASARDALVQAIGSVDWATDMLTALGDSPTLESLAGAVTQINAAKAALDQMGKNLVGFSSLTESAVSALVKAAGGMDGLVSAAGSYYDNFYSEAEKAANVTRDVASALADVGLAMPKTRQEFRALVEAQMALGESGTKAVAALLGVAGAFASVTAAVQSEQAAERADRLAAQRAREKQAAEALQKQIQDYADGAEQFDALRDSLLKAGDAAGLLAAVTERAFADPSGKYMGGKYELPRWESTDTAASFNFRYGEMQARLRAQAYADASANALRVQNVSGLMGVFSVEQMMSEYDPVTGPIKLAIQQAIVDASGDLGYSVRDAVSGAAMYAAMQQVRAQFSVAAPGLASVAAARVSAADASRSSYDTATGMYRMGGAAVEYGQALEALQAYMRSGAISVETFERAVVALDATLPGAAQSLGTLEDVIAAVERASYGVGTAGIGSIRYYFGSLSELTAEFAKAAGEAQEPIAQATAAIGRLNSAQAAFGGSSAAALEGFGGAGVEGIWALQNTDVSRDINRAQIIAEAAGIASAAMTTADAAAAAAKLAKSPAFAELTAQGIRDAALLLDGVGEYNAEGFERAFIRISDALAKGNVTEGQYKALFDTALDMFQGVPEETRALIDSMTRLRDAMSGFADGLLIDEQRTTLTAGATLTEMQRQYAQAFAGASTGDNEAIDKYQQLATTLLDKELYGSQAEYNAAFGRVYGDARQLESVGINTLAHAQGNEMVSELKDMNAKLNKRVEDLEKNLLAALAQIAKNTSDTSRGIEQQIVMAEEAP